MTALVIGIWFACLLPLGVNAAQASRVSVPVPPELASIPSVEQVFARLGVTAAEYSTHLELEAPDIISPGEVNVSGRSSLPGTTRLFLLRGGVGAPALVPLVQPSTRSAERKPARSGPNGQAKPPVPAAQAGALLAIANTKGEDSPSLEARYEVKSRQWVTLLAQAQGKWFVVAREIKVGRSAAALNSEGKHQP